jgi:arylsulfatase A
MRILASVCSLLVVMLAFAAASLAFAGPPHSETNRPPNIVLIVADDLGYGGAGCFGQERVKTPCIDALARSGMLFTDFYAGCCMCAPSRSVLMTGKHGGRTRVRENDPRQTLLAEDVTLAALLSARGYRCGGFGKWGLGDVGSSGEPSAHGFERWVGYLDQREAHFHYPDWIWNGHEKLFLEGNNWKEGLRQTYAPDVIHASALDFIRESKDAPFFCFVASTIPHAELLVPEDSLRQYDGQFPEVPYVGDHYASNEKPRATYAAMVTRFDRDIGRIVALLEELELLENTVVIFTSDNGPITAGGADPQFFKNAGPLRGLKFSLYEGGIRVPMIVSWKGRVAEGGRSSAVWGFDDLMVTLCDVADTESPQDVDGVSVLPEILGKKAGATRRYRYWETPGKTGLIQAVRAGSWKAIRNGPDADVELFDLANDLGESINVAQEHPEIVARLEQFMSEAHEPASF